MLRMILVGAVFAVGFVLGLRSVVAAACLWIWNDIFNPVFFARQHGFLSASWFMPVHFCTAVLIVAVVSTRWPKRWNFGAGAVTFLVIWVWVSYTQAQLPEIAYEQAVKTSKYMIPLIPIAMALCYRRAQQIFLYALAISVGIWQLHYGFMTVLSGTPEIRMGIEGGQMSGRNDFTVAGLACLPLLVYMGWHYRGPIERYVRWASRLAAVMAVGATFFSMSRGAIIGLGLLGLWWATATGRSLRNLTILVVLALLALPFVPDFVWERMETIEIEGEQTERSAYNRTVHMETAVEVTFDYPIFGCGPNCFPAYSYYRYGEFAMEPHSIWLKGSSEYGLTMFFFFVYVVGRLLIGLRRAAREARLTGDSETEALAVALSCAIVGFLAAGSFTSQFLSQYLWSIFVLSGAFLAKPRWQTADEAWKALSRTRDARKKAPTQGNRRAGAADGSAPRPSYSLTGPRGG